MATLTFSDGGANRRGAGSEIGGVSTDPQNLPARGSAQSKLALYKGDARGSAQSKSALYKGDDRGRAQSKIALYNGDARGRAKA